MNYTDLFRLVIPESIIVVTALLALLGGFYEKSGVSRKPVAGGISCLGCFLAILSILFSPQSGNIAMLSVTPLTQMVKAVLLLLTLFTAITSLEARFTRHTGEYFALLLLVSVGLMLLISSDTLLMIFVSLELVSLSLYALTAFAKDSLASAEAAMKYFLFGGMSAAFTLFGMSLLYGLTGEIQLNAIAAKLSNPVVEPIFYVAMVMTLIGFGFKVAAAPFHLWAPDVYMGAPTPVASFIASGSKVGSFFVLGRVLLTGFAGHQGSASAGNYSPGWMPVLAVIALGSMVIGNLAALVQKSVKRLLAYSAIAHAGYALLAFFATGQRALASLLFYVITYALTVMGAFAVVALVETGGRQEKFSDFAGLSRRAPLLSACMLVFVLSLAGIPPLAGFFGKFYVFTAAAAGARNLGLLWLAAVGIGASVVSLYYYLQILKQIYVVEGPATLQQVPAGLSQFAIATLAFFVVVLGCAPGILLGYLENVLRTGSF